jgi:hypothetical protein
MAGGMMLAAGQEFGAPFIDVDEWREEPRPHRYVHGGFEGTHTRFSFYFPPDDLYRGRMFQFLSGGAGGDENSLTRPFELGFGWAFDVVFDELGGFLVESNQGHFGNEGNTGVSGDLELFGASAEAAVYSKVFAEQVYGAGPHHSYVWGGSGGGLRSLCCIENRPDVWDGDVSFVIGEASGSSLSLTLAYWWLYCRDRRDDIIDATEPGGSGDPFAGLSDDERRALATLYRGGWNRGAESQLWASASWMFGMSGLKENDPSYFEDFWTKPGYLGHDHPHSLGSVLLDTRCTVTRVQRGPDGPGQMWLPALVGMGDTSDQPDRGSSYGIAVDADLGPDPNRLYMARATVLTGKAKGRQVYVAHEGELLLGERMTAPDMFDDVEVGDEIALENRDLIAWAHRWMYSLDLERWTVDDPATGDGRLAPEFAGLDFLLVDGTPIYPQREGRVLPVSQHGRIERKVIHVACTHDTIVPLPSVGHYHRMVREHLGDRVDDLYRLWWVENAPHGAAELLLAWTTPEKNPGVWRSRLIGYDGVIGEALRAIVRWVEDGTAPAPTTSYRFTGDSGLILADTATDRGGVQPVVRATANGATRAEVAVGEPVTFTGSAEQPPGTGKIVSARWDFTGTGEFVEQPLADELATLELTAVHTYDAPGTYFASFRVGAHHNGTAGRGLPVENGARVRVVVTGA